MYNIKTTAKAITLTFILLMVFTIKPIFSQDVIIKKNGDEINSKVLEITESSIKYKEYKFQEGPIRNINKSDVFMIMYENGKREKFISSKVHNINYKYKGKYFMFGFGVGTSYGTPGIRLQSRFGDIQGWGIHGGVGNNHYDETIYWSLGLKYFPYKNFYINTQFGVTDNEYVIEQIPFTTDMTGGYELRHGPSVLIGGDWNWGNKVGIGFNFGLGFSHTMNNEMGDSEDFMVAIDLGFIVRF